MNQVIKEKRETTTENILEKELSKMKRKKAGERLGWKAEWIKEEERTWQNILLFGLMQQKQKVREQNNGS